MSFDPYAEWQSIPKDRRPPDHYDLLGLDILEDDADKIQSQAKRRFAAVQDRLLGKNQHAAKQLLQEISAAEACLSDPKRKQEYDSELRRAYPAQTVDEPGIGAALDGGSGAEAGQTVMTCVCGKKLHVTPVHLGKQVRCRTCGAMINVPASVAVESDEATRPDSTDADDLWGEELPPADALPTLGPATVPERPLEVDNTSRWVLIAAGIVAGTLVVAVLAIVLIALSSGSRETAGDQSGSETRGAKLAAEPTGQTAQKPVAKPRDLLDTEITLDLGDGVTMALVLIPAGSFRMGDHGGESDEQPAREVRITKPFYLGAYEVTQEQWRAVMRYDQSYFMGQNVPVVVLSWDNCQAFVKKLQGKYPFGEFRLPTEAEWEYACRAGTTTWYCFGDDTASLGEYAWYKDNSDRRRHPVGQKKPNAWGLYDMHGNVSEWCWDVFRRDGYDVVPGDAATGTTADRYRVIRGGNWRGDPERCRTAYRQSGARWTAHDALGLRVAVVPPSE